MTLLELCDPLFQYVCVLNQHSQKGVRHDVKRVLAEVEEIFATMRRGASAGAGPVAEYDKIELPLMYFVDNIICTSNMNIAEDWPRLAFLRGENNGDKDFFKRLNAALDEGALEQLTIYYTCIGLGFRGEWTIDEDGPDRLKALMVKLETALRRLPTFPEQLDQGRITPEAYQYTRTENMTTPPVEPITRIVITLVGLLIVLAVMNAHVYRSESGALLGKLHEVAEPAAKMPDK